MKKFKLATLVMLGAFIAPNVNAMTCAGVAVEPAGGESVCYNQDLEEAFKAAKSGDKIVLYESVEVTKRINTSLDPKDNITLDLNGKNITWKGSSQGPIYVSGGELNIVGPGTIESNGDYAILVEEEQTVKTNHSNVTVGEDVTLKNAALMIDALEPSGTSANNVNVTFKGTIDTDKDFGIYVNGRIKTGTAPKINLEGAKIGTAEKNPSFGIYQAGNSDIVANGATIYGDTGIAVKNGTLTLNDTNITADGTYAAGSPRDGGVNSTGAAIQVESNDSYGDVKLSVNGGNYTSEQGNAIYEYGNASNTRLTEAEITDGTFESKTTDKKALELSTNFDNSAASKNMVSGGTFLANGAKSDVGKYLSADVVEGPDGTIASKVMIGVEENYDEHAQGKGSSPEVYISGATNGKYNGKNYAFGVAEGSDVTISVKTEAHWEVTDIYATVTEGEGVGTVINTTVEKTTDAYKATFKAPAGATKVSVGITYAEIQYPITIEYYVDNNLVGDTTVAGKAVLKLNGEEVTAAPAGSTVTVETTTNAGYKIANIVDWENKENKNKATATFRMTDAGVSVKVYYTANKYNVNVDKELQNGTIVATPGTTAGTGSKVSIKVTPSEGYVLRNIDDIVVKSNSGELIEVTPLLGAENTYEFTMPANNVTISAKFYKEYNVTVGTGIVDGTVEVDKTQATVGETITVTATPNDGFVVDKVVYIYDGAEHEATLNGDGKYEFTMPESDVTVSATFRKDEKYPITKAANSEEHGKVTVKESENGGNTVTVTVEPESGWAVDNIQVFKVAGNGARTIVFGENEVPVYLNGNTATFTMPNSAVEIKVTYKQITEPEATEYTITKSETENGSYTVSAEKAVKDTTVTVETTPADGYELSEITVTADNGAKIAVTIDGNKGAFTMPANNVTISVKFTKKQTKPEEKDPTPEKTQYSVEIGEVQNGSLTADKTTAAKGDKVVLTPSVKEGYKAASDSVVVTTADGTSFTATLREDGKYEFAMPEGNVTITATFKSGQTTTEPSTDEEQQPGEENTGSTSTPKEEENQPSAEETQPDTTVTENPQTYVSIFGQVALLVASVGALGFAVKKYLTR